MKAMRAAMRAMQAKKRVSKIAKGRFAKAVVLRGSKAKTSGGLTKTDLMKNRFGKVVSKRRNAFGKKAYRFVKDWTSAVVKARKALSVKGFVAVNGKTAQGKALYAKAKSFYTK